MRYFRIPNFSGIEAHRDDANRGSLRVVEGCFPVVTGGMSSGPVWEEKGTVDPTKLSSGKENAVTLKEDPNGNSVVMLSRNGKVHDIHVMTEPKTVMGDLGADELVYASSGDLDQRKAYFNSIGNRTLMIGEGSTDPVAIGKGPPSQQGEDMDVAPDYSMYGQEWKVFKRCKHFLVGPNKCIFAAGNCLDPLAVYVSEPAGVSAVNRDSPYSNDAISRVNILMSNATHITGLSLKGTQVIVHTDAGCHLLYSAKGVQATTGFRVEQRPTSVASAAASNAVVNRGYGTSPLWLGQDGHIYKDESASVGQEDQEKNTDKDQASYKAKSAFEHEMPQDLSDSFAVYDASSGTYITYVKSREYEAWQEAHGQTPETEDAYLCPADEDDSESDPVLTPEPTPVAEPEPIVVQPPEEPEIEDEPAQILLCGDEVAVVIGGVEPSTREHHLGTDEGEVSLDLYTLQVPDKIEVEWDGEIVINTGFVSFAKPGDPLFEIIDNQYLEAIEETPDGTWWKPINGEEVKSLEIGARFKFVKDKASPETAKVTVTPCPVGDTTKWEYILQCPKPTAVTECQAWFGGHLLDSQVVQESPDYQPIRLFEEDNSPLMHEFDTNAVTLLSNGEYPDAEELLKDPIGITFDLVAAPKGVRVRLYNGKDYERLVFDETGPFIYFNSFGTEELDEWRDRYINHLKEHHTQEELDVWGIDIDRDFDNTTYNMLEWGFRSKSDADKTFGEPKFKGVSLKIDCPEKEVITPQECLDNAEYVQDEHGWMMSPEGPIAVGFYMITPKFLTCLCNAYEKEEHLDDLLWTYEKLREANVVQAVVVTLDGSTGGANASYNPAGWGPFDGEGVLLMRMHTITGTLGGREPMDQFLESYRHEGVHAAQDLEHNLEVAFGQSTTHLLPVADEGVIWNQHGVNELTAYSRTPDMSLADWELLQKLELEGNSAEIDQKLTELAWELVGEKDTP